MARRTIALRDLIPRGPVLSARRWQALASSGPSGVAYEAGPTTGAPVMPLQVFGATYDLDLVLVCDHPSWDMHELARMPTPDGPVWLCKDSRAGTLEQLITADVDGLERWLPEIPLRRYRSAVEVIDRSTDRFVDVEVRYTNPDGEDVEVLYAGPAPTGTTPWRNSSTMGHSRDQALVALDLPARAFAKRASITIGGQRRAVRRILGIVPFQVALVQTQAGLSVGRWTQSDTDLGLRTVHGDVVQGWDVASSSDGVHLFQQHAVRTLTAEFVRSDGALELARMVVRTPGQDVASCTLHLGPHLPDARRPFQGVFEGHYALDVHGQRGHATGRVLAAWQGGALQLAIRPTSPRWTRDRPLDITVTRESAGHQVQVVRA